MTVKHYYNGVMRAMPWILYMCGIFYTAVTGDMIGVVFVVGMILFGNVFNQLLKRATRCAVAPWGGVKAFERPNPPRDGCGSFAEWDADKHRRRQSYGMPSGHAQQLAFAMGFWITHLVCTRTSRGVVSLLLGVLFFMLLWFLVSVNRIQLGCHNMAQVVVGSIVGTILGVWFYHMMASL